MKWLNGAARRGESMRFIRENEQRLTSKGRIRHFALLPHELEDESKVAWLQFIYKERWQFSDYCTGRWLYYGEKE